MVDAGQDVRRVEDDTTQRRSVDELDDDRRDHARRLADQKHCRDADQRPRQPPVLQRPPPDHISRPLNSLSDQLRRVDRVRRDAGRGHPPLRRLVAGSGYTVAVDHAG